MQYLELNLMGKCIIPELLATICTGPQTDGCRKEYMAYKTIIKNTYMCRSLLVKYGPRFL